MSSIRIFSQEFKVILESPNHWSEGGMGRASLMDQIIRINNSMPKDSQDSTLLHEVLHIISDMTGIELTEIQVNVIAQGLFTLIRDNPEFISKLGK